MSGRKISAPAAPHVAVFTTTIIGPPHFPHISQLTLTVKVVNVDVDATGNYSQYGTQTTQTYLRGIQTA